jgi:hypothetical protein
MAVLRLITLINVHIFNCNYLHNAVSGLSKLIYYMSCFVLYVDRVTIYWQYFRELNKINAILLYFKIITLIN